MLSYIFGKKGASGFGSGSTAAQIAEKYVDKIDKKVFIVTGANSGIGKETTRCLAVHGATVIMACRNMEKCTAAIEELKKDNEGDFKGTFIPMTCDVSSLASVRAFVEAFHALALPLHFLINNAGIMACPHSQTVDGNEIQFGTNHLGHFLLTELLLPDLKKSTGPSRIVIVSSVAHTSVTDKMVDFAKINSSDNLKPFAYYAHSKLANALHAKELNERLSQEEGNTVTVNALHPGAIATPLLRHAAPSFVQKIPIPFFKSVPQGAATSMYAICHPELKGNGGQYLADCNIYETTTQGSDPELWKALREVSVKLTTLNIVV